MANPQIEVELKAKIKDLEDKLGKANKELGNTGKEIGKLQDFAIGAFQGIAAAFSVTAIVTFGKAVLDTTAKFQKFEAVLQNTLGSESAAAQALETIKNFATTTPFAVDEVTASFVKLANQGFKPTVTELRALGDLAASTGKSFDQLTEAILDAQVGEFERLKEFGVRAKVQGDQVTFTFKGVETQVKNTSESIRQYVLSLGDAEGVSGAMAKISQTLGGRISELGDNIEQLRLAIGDQTSGVFATSITWLNEFVRLATLAAKSTAQIRGEVSDSTIGNAIEQNRKQVLELAEAYQKINPDITRQGALAKAIADVSRSFRDAAEGGEAFRNQSFTLSELEQIVEGFNRLSIELLNVQSSTDGAALSFEDFAKGYDAVNKALNQQESFIELEVENAEKLKKLGEEVLAIYDRLAKQIINENNPSAPKPVNFEIPGAPPVKEVAEEFKEAQQEIEKVNEILISSFSALGNQIASSFNIGNDALEGFISTLLSNTPKLIQAIFQQAAARKAAAAIENQAQAQVAAGAAIATGAKAASGLGPIGLAALPILIGGALALVSSAFKKVGSGSGVSGGGISGVGSGTSFAGSGATAGSFNRDLNLVGEFTIRGNDLVYVIDRSKERLGKG